MSAVEPFDPRPVDETTFSSALLALLGVACGLLIANVYYAQPLTGLITQTMGMPRESAGLLVTLPLAGYGLGLLAVVPLADLFENKRLVLMLVALEALCLGILAVAGNPTAFLMSAFAVGVTAAAVQILVPYVTFLAPEAERGKAVGKVVSGVMLGIMLARPAASFVSELYGWRAIFALSSAAMVALFFGLRAALPPRTPARGLTYPVLLRSLGAIFVSTPLLRRRAFYHAFMFGAFSVFWTALPLWLTGPAFGLSQSGVAWVALAGVAGAIAPPFAGRLADHGHSKLGTGLAMLLGMIAFLVSDIALTSDRALGITAIVAAAIVLDFAVSANLVFGQRAIYALGAEQRGRINGLFMATFFVGGAIGSAISGWTYSAHGWLGCSVVGAGLTVMALLYFATEPAPKAAP